jgi:serine/threonine protein kinase
MAPQVINQEGYDEKADIWSLGITAIEMAKGDVPYSDLKPTKALFLIPKNDPPTLEGDFSKSFKEFVSLCLVKDQDSRSSASQLLKHKFIRQAKSNAIITELIERKARWIPMGRDSDDESEETYDDESESTDSDHEQSTTRGYWDGFESGTVKSTGTVKTKTKGTVRGTVKSKPIPTEIAESDEESESEDETITPRVTLEPLKIEEPEPATIKQKKPKSPKPKSGGKNIVLTSMAETAKKNGQDLSKQQRIIDQISQGLGELETLDPNFSDDFLSTLLTHTGVDGHVPRTYGMNIIVPDEEPNNVGTALTQHFMKRWKSKLTA